MMQIQIEKCSKSRIDEVNFSQPGFGNYVTDHMFVADYYKGSWNDARIIPFQNLNVSPTMLALHYGQTVFEGMKAFRQANGCISIFRLKSHHERFNASLKRMCMPEIPYELFEASVVQLIKTDGQWLKDLNGLSLYIRPFVFATEERYGVKVSESYKFIIFVGVVGDYYARPLKVKVEEEYTRACKGGTGTAKCGGNYGGAFYPTHLAQQQGFDQVIWTTGTPDYMIEESGTMNIMVVINGVLITPSLSGSILGGITRDSLIKIAWHELLKVDERPFSAHELKKQLEAKNVSEAFGTGTAAVTAPIESISVFGNNYSIPEIDGSIRTTLHKKLLDIRTGRSEDIFNWNYLVYT